MAEAYSLLPGDLRDTKTCQAALQAANFDPACPTYVMAECVLVYMEPEDSASVVRWLGQWLLTAAFVVYEQVTHASIPSFPLDKDAAHDTLCGDVDKSISKQMTELIMGSSVSAAMCLVIFLERCT